MSIYHSDIYEGAIFGCINTWTSVCIFRLQLRQSTKCDKLVRVIGICRSPDRAVVIHEYCPRGDVYDLIQNAEKYTFISDWNLRLSMMKDMVEVKCLIIDLNKTDLSQKQTNHGYKHINDKHMVAIFLIFTRAIMFIDSTCRIGTVVYSSLLDPPSRETALHKMPDGSMVCGENQ